MKEMRYDSSISDDEKSDHHKHYVHDGGHAYIRGVKESNLHEAVLLTCALASVRLLFLFTLTVWVHW